MLANLIILKNVNVKMLQLQRVLRAVEALTENQLIDFRPYYQCVRVANELIRIIKSADISYDVNLRIRVAEVCKTNTILRLSWLFQLARI